MRSEWIKLRRPSMLLAGAATVCVTILATIAKVLSQSGSLGSGASFSQLAAASGSVAGLVDAGTIIGAISLAIAAGSMASEYSLGTVRNLVICQPRRLTLLAGKTAALLLFVAAAVTASTIASVGVALALAPSQHITTSAWLTATGLAAVAGAWANTLLAAAGFAMLGTVLAIVLRSPTAAIGAGLAWLLPAETLIGSAWQGARQLLPGQLLQGLAAGGVEGVEYHVALVGSLIVIAVAATSALYIFATRDA
jgi:ABC-type transport system involved in multi-copper enzyme maturation permease subunit